MSALSVIRQLWQHCLWADEELLRALGAASGDQDEAWREYLHVLGAEEVWLSRLEQRAARTPVWPSGSPDAAAALRITIAGGYAVFLEQIEEDALHRSVSYTTSDGRQFTNALGDILTHVALHGQYHRGRVNLLLRQRQMSPAPMDYIAFVRGAASATNTVPPTTPAS